MKQLSRKFWIVFSFVVLATSAIFAYNKLPGQKGKSTQIVVDRLVNRLVCQVPVRTQREKNRFSRGVLAVALPAITARSERSGRWSRPTKNDKSDYCTRSSHKIVAGRDGKRRGDNNRPIGGDL